TLTLPQKHCAQCVIQRPVGFRDRVLPGFVLHFHRSRCEAAQDSSGALQGGLDTGKYSCFRLWRQQISLAFLNGGCEPQKQPTRSPATSGVTSHEQYSLADARAVASSQRTAAWVARPVRAQSQAVRGAAKRATATPKSVPGGCFPEIYKS